MGVLSLSRRYCRQALPAVGGVLRDLARPRAVRRLALGAVLVALPARPLRLA